MSLFQKHLKANENLSLLFDLYAQGEVESDKQLIKQDLTKNEAEHYMNVMEELGTWPEGFDAVLYQNGKAQYFYADDWETL